jgi:transcriptional regulator with XRE-family HTH domain
MTQEEVAEAADLDRAYYAGIEVGLRNPSLRPLIRIARALDVPLSELFRGVR